jgi:hypothetical protein
MKGLSETVFSLVAVSLVLVYCTAVIDMPDVHVSNMTGECVKVINYAENDSYTCEVLPTKYNHVWVK